MVVIITVEILCNWFVWALLGWGWGIARCSQGIRPGEPGKGWAIHTSHRSGWSFILQVHIARGGRHFSEKEAYNAFWRHLWKKIKIYAFSYQFNLSGKQSVLTLNLNSTFRTMAGHGDHRYVKLEYVPHLQQKQPISLYCWYFTFICSTKMTLWGFCIR